MNQSTNYISLKNRPRKSPTARRILVNTRPHQLHLGNLHWSDREMGTAISCIECGQVVGFVGRILYQCAYTFILHPSPPPSLPRTHTPGFSLGSDPSGIQSVQRKVRTRVVSSGSSFISCLPYFFILASTCVCVYVGREGEREGGGSGVWVWRV